MLAVKNRQVDAFMYDDAFLVGVAANDPDLKMSGHRFLNVPWGIGIRKGETAMRRWVNTAINGMAARNMFWPIMRRTIRAASIRCSGKERPESDEQASVPARHHARQPMSVYELIHATRRPLPGRPLVFHKHP